MLRYRRLNEVFATDTYFSSVTSVEGYNCSQVFVGLTSNLWKVHGMKTESEFPDVYLDFCRNVGIPSALRRDNAKSEKSARVKEIHRELVIADEWTEPHSPWQNPAELRGVKSLKAQTQVLMDRTNTPDHLWFACQEYICEVHNHCADPNRQWNIPQQVSRGDTTDISHLLQFHWLQPVLYLDPVASFPVSKELPGFFGGFSPHVGDTLTFKIFKPDLKTSLDRSVVRAASDQQHRNRRVRFNDTTQQEIEKLDSTGNWEDFKSLIEEEQAKEKQSDEEEEEEPQKEPKDDSGPISSRTRSKNKPMVRGILNTRALPHRNRPGLLSTLLQLPVLIFALFHVFNHVQNLCKSPDIPVHLGEEEAQSYQETFVNNKKNDMEQLKYVQAVDTVEDGDDPVTSTMHKVVDEGLWDCTRVEGHRVRHKGSKEPIWEVKCRWNDPNKSTSWVDMYALAMQDPVPILRYAQKTHILKQAPFTVLSNYCTGEAPSHLARAFKAQMRPNSPKYQFGVQVPMGLKQAYALDKANGNRLWHEAIEKEVKQVNDYKTFRTLKDGEVLSSEYKKIPYHIVFAVKFDLRRKARLVAGGNWTNLAREDMYSGVVAMETVCTGFLIGELNNLTCCAGDVGNAYLYSKTREKVYIIAGPEFGEELEGKS